MSVNLFKDVFLFRWTTYGGIKNNLKSLSALPKQVWERATKGLCEADIWDFNSFIIEVLPAAIRYLKDHMHSYPYTFTPESWAEYLEEMAACFERGCKKTVDNIPFELYTPEWNDAFIKLEQERKEAIQKGFKMMADRFDNLWD